MSPLYVLQSPMKENNLSPEDYERIEQEFIRREEQRANQEKRKKRTKSLIELAVLVPTIISIYVLGFLVFLIFPPADRSTLIVGFLVLFVIAMGMGYLMRKAIKYFTTKFPAEQSRERQSG